MSSKAGPVWDARIREWMTNNLEQHRDPQTGEINTTTLAEGACEALDLYIEDEGIPSDLFEIAFEVYQDAETEVCDE